MYNDYNPVVIRASLVKAFIAMVWDLGEWTGKATDLLPALIPYRVPDSPWPDTALAAVVLLSDPSAQEQVAAEGIHVTRRRVKAGRIWHVSL